MTEKKLLNESDIYFNNLYSLKMQIKQNFINSVRCAFYEYEGIGDENGNLPEHHEEYYLKDIKFYKNLLDELYDLEKR